MPTPSDPPLTIAKREQAIRRKDNILRGGPLPYNAAIRHKYESALTSLVNHMTDRSEREITNFFSSDTAKEFYAHDDSISAQAKIITNQLTKKFTQIFSDKAQGMAQQMVNESLRASSAQLHKSLHQLTGGLSLKTTVITGPLNQVIAASVTENVGLIKSISSEYFTNIQGAVMRSITTGRGQQDLVPYLKKYLKGEKQKVLRRARLIASDQTKKAYGNINAIRLQALGFDRYEWLHSSGGKEPRKLHEHLSGKICSLSKPPIIQYANGSLPEVRGKPGDLINCRCTMRPIIDFDKLEG